MAMKSLRKYRSIYLFSLLFLLISVPCYAAPSGLRIYLRDSQYGAQRSSNIASSSSSLPKDVAILRRRRLFRRMSRHFIYYPQTLDHFNYLHESFATFPQRYVINSKYCGGANSSAPILAFLGAESSIDYDAGYVGFLDENAPRLKTYHRYYGSVLFGPIEEAMKDATLRGYFNSDQAIADYAVVLLHLKEKLSAKNSPIIVVGGSYGGMLAAWFRLKYVIIGALDSSALILYFDNITPESGYYSIVSKSFKKTSESCYETIRRSWAEIDEVATKPNGLSILSKTFKTCNKLKRSFQGLLGGNIYSSSSAAGSSLGRLCNAIDGAPKKTGILGKISAGLLAFKVNRSCYYMDGTSLQDQLLDQWNWQDLKLVLHKFASNIIFSNGLKDPYSTGSVLENITYSVVAVTTAKGSHCLNIRSSTPSDPHWLVKQRKTELEIVEGWISRYHADSASVHDSSSSHDFSSN